MPHPCRCPGCAHLCRQSQHYYVSLRAFLHSVLCLHWSGDILTYRIECVDVLDDEHLSATQPQCFLLDPTAGLTTDTLAGKASTATCVDMPSLWLLQPSHMPCQRVCRQWTLADKRGVPHAIGRAREPFAGRTSITTCKGLVSVPFSVQPFVQRHAHVLQCM